MDNIKSILITIIIITSLILNSCNGSVKGKWSESDKQNFRKEMEGIKELSNIGEYKTKWVECYLSKCEANYSSYSEGNSDQIGLNKIALECNEEILTNISIKGKWSESDKQTFRKEMEDIKGLSNFGEKKSKWIECYLNKCEANFSSYSEVYTKVHTNKNELEKIALECNVDVFSNGSIKGKWTNIDKQNFREDMAGIKELSNFGKNKTKWIECYLSKCESNYSSYYESNYDKKGLEMIALECNEEIK
jgi:hypothetical protein